MESTNRVRVYCWVNQERECGGDCVLFDPDGAVDTTGSKVSCRFANHVDGACRALISMARKQKTETSIPGVDVPPPTVGV